MSRPVIDLDELVDACEFVSACTSVDAAAYVSRETGRIFSWTEEADLDEDVPDDVEDDGNLVPIPAKTDLDLGASLAREFARQYLGPPDADTVSRFFDRPGAYARFKDLLERRRMLERWYRFEADAVRHALRDWARENGLTVRASTGTEN